MLFEGEEVGDEDGEEVGDAAEHEGCVMMSGLGIIISG